MVRGIEMGAVLFQAGKIWEQPPKSIPGLPIQLNKRYNSREKLGEEQTVMERIAVIGNGGGGKTTLCLRLHAY